MLEINAEIRSEISKALANPSPRMAKALRSAFQQIGQGFIARHRRERLRGRPGLRQRHGQAGLAGSFGFEIVGMDLDSMQLVNYSTSRYARIHEHGGIIRPKRANFLTIPLDAAKSGAKDSADVRIRDFNGFFAMSNGRLFFFDSKTKAPLFILKRQVTIPPRLEWVATWDRMESDFAEKIAQKVAKAMEGDS